MSHTPQAGLQMATLRSIPSQLWPRVTVLPEISMSTWARALVGPLQREALGVVGPQPCNTFPPKKEDALQIGLLNGQLVRGTGPLL